MKKFKLCYKMDRICISNGQEEIIMPQNMVYNFEGCDNYIIEKFNEGINIIIDDNLESEQLDFLYYILTCTYPNNIDDLLINEIIQKNDFIIQKYNLRNSVDTYLKKMRKLTISNGQEEIEISYRMIDDTCVNYITEKINEEIEIIIDGELDSEHLDFLYYVVTCTYPDNINEIEFGEAVQKNDHIIQKYNLEKSIEKYLEKMNKRFDEYFYDDFVYPVEEVLI